MSAMVAATAATASATAGIDSFRCVGWALGSLWILSEVIFGVVFFWKLVPKANERRPAAPYRAPYDQHKHILLRRIVQRICNDCNGHKDDNDSNGKSDSDADVHHDHRDVFRTFVTSWFRAVPVDRCDIDENDLADEVIQGKSNDDGSTASVAPSLRPLRFFLSRRSSRSHQKGNSHSKGQASAAQRKFYAKSYSLSSSENSDASSMCSTSSSEDDKQPLADPNVSKATSTSFSSWTIPGLYRAEMDDFLAWALFAKDMVDMDGSDRAELERCYQELNDTLQFTVPFEKQSLKQTPQFTRKSKAKSSSSGPSSSKVAADNDSASSFKWVPRRLSLEDARPWHRPLAVYLVVHVLRTVVAGGILRAVGFQRVVSKSTGLQGWIRRPRRARQQKDDTMTRMPLVFFHGIAPAGLLLYLPMLLFGLLSRDRVCILVEHPNISCTLTFGALSEQETVRGVEELLQAAAAATCSSNSKGRELADQSSSDMEHVTLCGHSFGSCPISWLLNDAAFRPRVRLCVLMDPVTVLLSDPAVMLNFLYSREVSNIRVIASSELCTEYYLRRHFSWYNSELWLDEVFSGEGATASTGGNDTNGTHLPMHAIVALSENDEIVDAPKVKRHADLFLRRQARMKNSRATSTSEATFGRYYHHQHSSLRTVYWKGAKHASCVTDPRKWRDLQKAMLQSELELLQHQPRQ